MEENKTQNQIESERKVQKEGSVGATIGSVIVILVILAGGLYFMNSLREKIQDDQMLAEQQDNFSEINTELNSIEIEDLGAELEQIEAEIDASF